MFAKHIITSSHKSANHRMNPTDAGYAGRYASQCQREAPF